jgi:hypothetical protein
MASIIVRLAPPVLSLLVLGAHFFRGGAWPVTVVVVALVAALTVRRRWIVRLVQVVLLLGAIEWVATLLHLAFWRAAAGEPFVRLVGILGGVAAVTAASAFVFQTAPLRRFYGFERTVPGA